MSSAYDSYATAMRGDAWKGWWITWPLSLQVRVGDVFDVSGGGVRSAGDLAARGVAFNRGPTLPAANFLYDSNGSATVRFKLAGGAPQGFSALAQADAGALVEFADESSILAVYSGLTQEGMRDTRALAAELVRLYWADEWSRDIVAVTDVVSATGSIVLAAAGRRASAELRIGAAVGAGQMTIADLAGAASVARAAQLGLQWVGSDVTPFHRVVRLRQSWLNGVTAQYGPRQPGRGAGPEPVPPILVEEARDDPTLVVEAVPVTEQPPPAAAEEPTS